MFSDSLFGIAVQAYYLENTFQLLVGGDVVFKLITGVKLVVSYYTPIIATSNPLRSSLSTVSMLLTLPKSWTGFNGWPMVPKLATRESASQVSRTTLEIG